MASTHSPPSSGFCGLSCFGNNDATEIIGEKSVAPRRKRLSMWNGELEDPSDMPAVKNRLSPEELHRLPEEDVLNDIAKVTLLDKNRHKTTFGELTNDANYKRVIVIFIRHFFCGMCYGYVKNISADLMPGKLDAMATPTKLVIIGCGDPILIPQYVKETLCPFEIYSDTGRKLYQKLGFCVNGEANEEPPAYVRKYSPKLMKNLMVSGKMAAKTGKTSGGLINQNGGEMIYINGALKFIHRMRNTTDHVEVEELEQILESQDIEMAEEADAQLADTDRRSNGADTKRSKTSRRSWSRPMSFFGGRKGSFFGGNSTKDASVKDAPRSRNGSSHGSFSFFK
ncbi:hypothetical protein MBLNU457_6863t1 [Dothideomycetes sp. NU457]